jgi:hypothetical protein
MKKLLLAALILILGVTTASAQSNKIIFGPLVGDEAGILRGDPGETIEVEMWVRTDPANPTSIVGVAHGLSSENVIIDERNSVDIEPEYDEPYWCVVWVDGPFIHNPADDFPIPEGLTCEIAVGLYIWWPDCIGWPLDTQGEWDLFGTWFMVTNTEIPIDQTYYPFSIGWYPHSGQGTNWAFDSPPGGNIEPEQSYCGLYFEPETTSVEENQIMPAEFSLDQNYPNPFNATTSIQYDLPEESEVTIEIYNILGRKVETLISGILPAGWHSVIWDAENQPSGVYFYRINAGENVESRNCLLLK